MARSDRMAPVVRVMEERQQVAARRLAECQQQIVAEEARLEEFRNYRIEYLANLQQRASSGMAAQQYVATQQFVVNIDQAIEQQAQQVALVRQRCQQLRQEWQQAHTRSRAVDKVVERLRTQEEQAAARREQREIDEFANRRRRDG
jgi:flagellar protein FliJ